MQALGTCMRVDGILQEGYPRLLQCTGLVLVLVLVLVLAGSGPLASTKACTTLAFNCLVMADWIFLVMVDLRMPARDGWIARQGTRGADVSVHASE